MKLFILLSLFSFVAIAAESKTECPWMKESMKRSNPKAQMNFEKSKVEIKSSKAIRQ